MDKKKLSTEDGSEFTVFYLKEQNKQEQESDIHAPVGWMGSNEIASYFTPIKEDNWNAIDKHGQQKEDMYKISIDDTITSDFVAWEDLIAGRLYKSHRLGVVVRFVSIAESISDISNKPHARVSRHGRDFLMEVADMKKATQVEVEKYLEKNID